MILVFDQDLVVLILVGFLRIVESERIVWKVEGKVISPSEEVNLTEVTNV